MNKGQEQEDIDNWQGQKGNFKGHVSSKSVLECGRMLWTECLHLPPLPQNSCAEILTSNVMVFGDGGFGRPLGFDGVTRMKAPRWN